MYEGLRPDPEIINVLRGKISKPMPTVSHKPGPEAGQLVTVRIALEGSGMYGLSDYADNRLWWGISRGHQGNFTALAGYYGMKMQQAGYKVDLQAILNTGNVSHGGRRPWEEACYYPDIAPDAAIRSSMANETLGLRLIKNKVPDDVFMLAASLAYSDEFPVGEEVFNSLEHRLLDLADHQTTQNFAPLYLRMGDFLSGNFFEGLTTSELRKPVSVTLGDIIKRQRDFCLGTPGSKKVTLDEADDIMLSLGAKPNSSRSTLRLQLANYLKDAETQAVLLGAGVDPDKITDGIVKVPEWEHRLRFGYVEFAKGSLIEAVGQGYCIPTDTEWGRYAQMVLPKSLRIS